MPSFTHTLITEFSTDQSVNKTLGKCRIYTPSLTMAQ